MTKYVAYYQSIVPTKQGVSQLGLDAQREAVHKYIAPRKNLLLNLQKLKQGPLKNRVLF
jgi:hypothetical protein